MSIMLIFLADITYHPLSGPALTRRPPPVLGSPTAAPVAVSHTTIIDRYIPRSARLYRCPAGGFQGVRTRVWTTDNTGYR